MPQPLPALLRFANDYLSGVTGPTGRRAEHDDARAVLRDADGDHLAQYLE